MLRDLEIKMAVNEGQWLEHNTHGGAWKRDLIPVFPVTDILLRSDAKCGECVEKMLRKDGTEVTIRFRV